MSSITEMPQNMDSKQKKVIEFKSSPEHYKAEACVVWCFDARFAKAYDAFLAGQGFSADKVDAVKRAGGAKALAMEGSPQQSDVKDQIAGAIKLHQADRVILMVHMDCGAYGGAKAFDNDHQKEWDHHVAELQNSAAFVERTFPEIEHIETWIADFDGIHQIDEFSRSAENDGKAAAAIAA